MTTTLVRALAAAALLTAAAVPALADEKQDRIDAKKKAVAEAKEKARAGTLEKAKEHTRQLQAEAALEQELLKDAGHDAGRGAAAPIPVAPLPTAPSARLTAHIVEEMELHELREAQFARLVEVTTEKKRSPLSSRVLKMKAGEDERHRLALARLKRAKDVAGRR